MSVIELLIELIFGNDGSTASIGFYSDPDG